MARAWYGMCEHLRGLNKFTNKSIYGGNCVVLLPEPFGKQYIIKQQPDWKEFWMYRKTQKEHFPL
jgi:hypothetical protein